MACRQWDAASDALSAGGSEGAGAIMAALGSAFSDMALIPQRVAQLDDAWQLPGTAG